MIETCEKCLFWDKGECRRHSPQPNMILQIWKTLAVFNSCLPPEERRDGVSLDELGTTWPRTEETDWCGDFERKN